MTARGLRPASFERESHRQSASALADQVCEYQDALEGLLFLRELGPTGEKGVEGVLRSKPLRVLASSWALVELLASPYGIDIDELMAEFIPPAWVETAKAALFGASQR